MKQIEVKVLNPEAIHDAEKMLAVTARLTQRAEKISSLEDFMQLYEKPYTEDFIHNMCELPHPTIQKFGLINIVVVGASRRFLAQITRHQNEIKFMSGSLQYSDYSSENNKTDFVIPYRYIGTSMEDVYLDYCKQAFKHYQELVELGKANEIIDAGDAAGYEMPQGLRNVLVMSARPYQWKYMIGLRSCNRNTKETQYVLMKIWEQLYNISPAMFGNIKYGCMNNNCEEGKMACWHSEQTPICQLGNTPTDMLHNMFPKLYE